MTQTNGQSLMQRLPFGFSKRNGVVIAVQDDGVVALLCKFDAEFDVIAEAQRFFGAPLKLIRVSDDAFSVALNQAYQTDADDNIQLVEDLGESLDLQRMAESLPVTEDLMDQQDDAPIIRLINALLTEAVREGASDIHIETFENQLMVRFRVDGMLREVVQPKRALATLLTSRIKVMAKLDIAEKRIPQDGRIALKIAGKSVDVRVSTMPSNHGERVVLRLLDKQAGKLNFSDLGMDVAILESLKQLIKKPHGILLVTGPTGSGKTTTLYAALQSLNHHARNIMTVEDPIEYSLPGIGQTQVNNKVSMTFAKGLRAILRQDPDVVMIGEIRDLETAQIAVESSLTGHLVLSTLHTNSAVGAVTRLKDMGTEPFLLSSSLIGVLSQRLVRTLCPVCKSERTADKAELELLAQYGMHVDSVPVAQGCTQCRHTGYRGRTGVYELVTVTPEIQALIHNESSEHSIEMAARATTKPIFYDGLMKVSAGVTTIEEVLRVCDKAL